MRQESRCSTAAGGAGWLLPAFWLMTLAVAPCTLAGAAAAQAVGRPVVVASKPFAESYVLAEIFAQLLESRGYRVERRPGLGATEIAFGAVRSGAVDVYPEYTGTGLVAILGEPPSSDAGAVLREVSRAFRARWGAHWLAPLGFENTYAIAVRRETAARYGLRTLTDLARAAPSLTAGFTPDFIGRPDGLPGLARAYGGMRFRDTRSLLQAVKYEALAAAKIDVIDGYSTDGAISRYDLVVLADDRGFFPSYQAAPLVGARLWREAPGAVEALSELGGLLDAATMRTLNRRVEVDHEPVAAVARAALAALGLTAEATGTGPRAPTRDAGRAATSAAREGGDGTGNAGSLMSYLWARRATLARLTARHLLLVGASLLVAILIAVPLGLGLERLTAGRAEGVIRAVGVLQTLPSIALLAFMIPLFGIGVPPALVALFLYSLYPIVRNTYSGVRSASPEAVAAAHALGMTGGQILRYVRLPLAMPVILAGIRTAGVIGVGTATLAAFIGAGGLGDPIVAGLALADTRMILSGAIPAALLALVVEAALAGVERVVKVHG